LRIAQLGPKQSFGQDQGHLAGGRARGAEPADVGLGIGPRHPRVPFRASIEGRMTAPTANTPHAKFIQRLQAIADLSDGERAAVGRASRRAGGALQGGAPDLRAGDTTGDGWACGGRLLPDADEAAARCRCQRIVDRPRQSYHPGTETAPIDCLGGKRDRAAATRPTPHARGFHAGLSGLTEAGECAASWGAARATRSVESPPAPSRPARRLCHRPSSDRRGRWP
jgi:hypothetical protein